MGLRTAPPVSAAPALPSLDAIINGESSNEPGNEATKAPEPEKEQGALERIEREQKHRRELFALQKQNKELLAKQRDPGNQASPVAESKNPIKDLAKARNLSQDDVVRMALEAMDDDQTLDEKKSELKNMTPQEIAKLVKAELDKEKQSEAQSASETKAIADFKVQISTKAKELADKFPMVDALGGQNAAFDLIDSQYRKDVEEYGADYAAENMLSIDEAIQKTNETLAINVKDALKSKHLRDFILKAIKDDGLANEKADQSNGKVQLEEKEESVTMTNKGYRPATEASGKPTFSSDAEELDFLINKLT